MNRNEYDVAGDQMEVTAKDKVRYFDLYHGVELKPETRPGGRTVLGFSIEAKGYGAILATNAAPDQKVQALMSRMKELTATPLASYSHEWKVVPQQIVPIQPTKAATGAPAGMVKIPEADFLFKSPESRSKDSMTLVLTCSIRGKTRRADFTSTPCM